MGNTGLRVGQEFITFESIQDSLGLNDRTMLKNYLEQVFNDLKNLIINKKFNKAFIPKIVFYDYLKLPVFIADKVFRSFSKLSAEGLCKEEFVDNLVKLYTGSFDDTVSLIFNILDYDKDGKINKDDIKIFLSYLPIKGVDEESYSENSQEKNSYNPDYSKKEFEVLHNQFKGLAEIYNIVDKSFSEFGYSINKHQFTQMITKNNSEIFLQILCFLYYKMPFIPENIEALKTNHNTTETEKSRKKPPEITIKNSGSIQIKLPKYNSLLAPVRMFYKKIKGRINLLKANINKIYYRKDKGNNIYYNLYKENNNSFYGNNIVNKSLKINPVEYKKNNENKIYENYIYEINGDNKVEIFYIVLINKDIYFYKSHTKKEFVHMHNLTECYVEELDKIKDYVGKTFYPFKIYFKNTKDERKFYTHDENICKEFVKKIREAIGIKILSDYYEEKEKIGRGRFGVVNLGINKKTGMEVAIKRINKDSFSNSKDQELLLNEIDILKHCHHPYIIRLIDHFEDYNYIYLILEYIKGGNLGEYSKKISYNFSEEHAANIMNQIAKGIKYLHLFGIIHKDLKPTNIMITQQDTNGIIKICDFGLSEILSGNEKTTNSAGTLTFYAPEVLLGIPHNKEVDIWALGVILYLLLSGKVPFRDKSEKETMIKIVKEELKFDKVHWGNKSQTVQDLIKSCLQKSKERRINIDDFINHLWFKNNKIKKYSI